MKTASYGGAAVAGVAAFVVVGVAAGVAVVAAGAGFSSREQLLVSSNAAVRA